MPKALKSKWNNKRIIVPVRRRFQKGKGRTTEFQLIRINSTIERTTGALTNQTIGALLASGFKEDHFLLDRENTGIESPNFKKVKIHFRTYSSGAYAIQILGVESPNTSTWTNQSALNDYTEHILELGFTGASFEREYLTKLMVSKCQGSNLHVKDFSIDITKQCKKWLNSPQKLEDPSETDRTEANIFVYTGCQASQTVTVNSWIEVDYDLVSEEKQLKTWNPKIGK